MKCKLFVSLFILFSLTHNLFANLTLDGTYQGKNLYVQNAFSDDGFSYCTDSISVNDEQYLGNISTGAYEIKLDSLGFELGDSIHIVIYHANGCKPAVLNSNICHFSPKLNIDSLKVSNEVVSWKNISINPLYQSYYLQQYKWNRWITLSTIDEQFHKTNKGRIELTTFLHAGKNSFRILTIDTLERKTSYSEFHQISELEEISVDLDKKEKQLTFNRTSSFELYSSHGDIISKGNSNKIDLSDLQPGKYFLNVGNQSKKITLRK